MPHNDGEEKRPKKSVVYKNDGTLPTASDRRPTRVVISKSRYKLYEPPQRSTFSVCLDNIKRERQSIFLARKPSTSGSISRRSPDPSVDDFRKRIQSISFANPSSSTGLTEKKRLYFKDALLEYQRRRTIIPRRIKIIKVYAPQNWEEAFEESVKKYKPAVEIENPWRQPRLLWLQEIEKEPLKLPRDTDEPQTPCCPLFMFPFRK
ncbi:uncharacterized protein LOC134225099 [Armigeres subalbatus]|uniref:uncharacterized protein LOC134225099 n=1 Tax=Armigeres subalbatus TaxID=124917 RepID=UPI002ED6645B